LGPNQAIPPPETRGSGPESKVEVSRASILVYALIGVVALCLLSIPQKVMLGADPFSLKGFLVPALFGGLSGLAVGNLLVRIKGEYLNRIRIQQEGNQDLMESEERFRLLAENARDVIFIWSLTDHRYEYLSPSVYDLTGHLPEEFYVDPGLFESLVHTEDRSRIHAIGESIRRSELPPVLEYQVQHRDGSSIWINQRHTVATDDEGHPLTLNGICTDVTEFRHERLEKLNLEQQLQQAQKMEAIGRLAGGIAHDFNNLLTVINGYVDLLLDTVPVGQPAPPELLEIKRAGTKAADLTNQLLAFSRNQVANPQLLKPGEAVLESLTMVQRMMGEDVIVQAEIADDLPDIFVDPTHLDQILVNLLVNARDAVDKVGSIQVKVAVVDLTREYCCKCQYPLSGEYLSISVQDNGRGIEPAILERVFDPFFTTKEVGQGTGLGLSTVFGIVHQMEGHVQVSSQPGHGTTFRVLIPMWSGPVAAAKVPAMEQPPVSPGGGETILVVEDEALLRSLAATVLGHHGYTIHLAENGKVALGLLEDLEQKVDLVLTDIVMPVMDGMELAHNLSQLAPQLPVLFMSGYAEEVLDYHSFDPDTMPLLRKPFGAEELLRRIRQALDG
jgi:two-component system cell cycle sensor histidine kinase/response regulator CckA